MEFPLHRFCLELMVADGAVTIAIVLFDKVAEFLLKHKVDSLYKRQLSKVGGAKWVATILQQVNGNTQMFHAKVDKLMGSNGKKLTATRIAPRGIDTFKAKTDPNNTKVNVHVNDSIGGVSITSEDLLNVLSSYTFNSEPFSINPKLQPAIANQRRRVINSALSESSESGSI